MQLTNESVGSLAHLAEMFGVTTVRIKQIEHRSLRKLRSVIYRECSACLQEFADDIYWFRGRLFCGDCRYFARHGKCPPREATTDTFPTFPISELNYRGRGTAELCGRFCVLPAVSDKHAAFLLQWIRDCSLSID